MDDALALDPLHARLPLDGPFTRATAYAAGISRAGIERMLRQGTVRRLLRGVYVVSTATDDRRLRASAAALAAGGRGIVVDRTAAFVHGLGPEVLIGEADGVVPLDLAPRLRGHGPRHGTAHLLVGHDVVSIGGLHLTTPLRTALDLGRLLPPGRALAAMDALVVVGGLTHAQLLAELPRMAGSPGVGQLRRLVVQVDGRARGTAESVLRLHWHSARLPTPVPGLVVVAAGRPVRLALAVERRQFAAVVSGQLQRGEVTADDLAALERDGWRVVVLGEERLLRTAPEIWVRHLVREFHQQLVAQT